MACNTVGNPTVWFGHNYLLKYPVDQLQALLLFRPAVKEAMSRGSKAGIFVTAEDEKKTLY